MSEFKVEKIRHNVEITLVTNERMVVDRENPNRRAATGQDASPLSCAGMPEPDSRDHQERFRAVA